MAEDEREGVERVREWIGRLEAFASTLDSIDAHDPTDFCESACDAWIDTAFREPPLPATAATLIILETLKALADVATVAVTDYYNTPDVRDRMTRDAAQRLLSNGLDQILRGSQDWLDHRLLPSVEEIEARSTAVLAGLRAAQEAAEKIKAEEEAREAEATAYSGVTILGCYDPNRAEVSINLAKNCSFTERENRRHRDGCERPLKIIDSGLSVDTNCSPTWWCGPAVAYTAERCC